MDKEAKNQLSGPEKAAILCLVLGEDVMTKVFGKMDDKEVKEISNAMNAMRGVPLKNLQSVMEEFVDQTLANTTAIHDGSAITPGFLQKSLEEDRASGLIRQLAIAQGVGGLDSIKNIPAASLLNVLEHEHPQTIAVVLSLLPSSKSSSILAKLRPEMQADIVARIVKLNKIPLRIIEDIDRELGKKIQNVKVDKQVEAGGVRSAAEMINELSRDQEEQVLQGLSKIDPEMTTEIIKKQFVFEDLKKLEDREIQTLLKDVDMHDLAVSMKMASAQVKSRIMKNMSGRAADILKEEIDLMGNLSVQDVEDSQAVILMTAKRLEEEGRLVLRKRK